MNINGYLILAMLAIGLPVLYCAVLAWNKPYFELEKNRNRAILKSMPEYIVIFWGEIVTVKIWYEFQTEEISGLILGLLYIILVIMCVLCMTDYWETLVPNRILLLCIVCCFLELGLWWVKDRAVITEILPSMILGLIFCMLSFGIGYLLSKGSMGSGDVKLALVLGMFLTGEYVVRTVFFGCLISAFYSMIQLLRKKLNRKDEIPFVPFLYIGLIITYLVG